MGDHQLARWRLHNLGLAGAPWPDVAAVVGRLGAVQAQEFGPALWSIHQRLGGTTEDALLAAVDAGQLVRTHVLRPTWHFVLPADVRWMLELTAPRVHAFNAYYYRKYELDETTLAACHRLLAEALAGENALTRAELATVLDRGGVAADGLRLGLILMHAELERLIASGPRRGAKHTYALLDEQVPAAPEISREAALAELTRRYFTSHGPATAKDFAWWSSLTMAEIRRGLDLAGDRLEASEMDGVTYWHAAGDDASAAASVPAVYLLAPYDEYVVAYSESKAVADRAGWAAHRPERGAYIGTVVRDTQLAGFWKRTVRRDEVVVHIQYYEPFDDASWGALQQAVVAHGRFLGRSGVLTEPVPLLGDGTPGSVPK
jgi:hypothetical protein